jgi:hypothetical protein
MVSSAASMARAAAVYPRIDREGPKATLRVIPQPDRPQPVPDGS